jgi:hypothetical protein
MTIYMIRGETVTAHAAAPAKPPKGSLTIRSAGDIAGHAPTGPYWQITFRERVF